jgi:hypothetical protein
MAAFAIMGFAQLKNSVCYTWLFNLVHSNDKQSICSFINAFDTLTLCITCCYFVFLSREWFYLYFIMTFLGTVSYAIIILCVPESPKWLLLHNKTQEAIDSFNYISKMNCSKTLFDSHTVFVES